MCKTSETKSVDELKKQNLWGEHPEFIRERWIKQVICHETNLGYWEWVQHQLETDAEPEELYPDDPKVKKVCEHCGAEDITFHAYVGWNTDIQNYYINDVLDTGFCTHCIVEITGKEVAI